MAIVDRFILYATIIGYETNEQTVFSISKKEYTPDLQTYIGEYFFHKKIGVYDTISLSIVHIYHSSSHKYIWNKEVNCYEAFGQT